MALGPVTSGTLGQYNVGAAAAVGFLAPLSAQLDALLAVSLGPFQATLSAQLNGALAASAGLAIAISNPLASIQALLVALVSLQAALQAALALPGLPSVQIGAQLSASLALSATLAAQLGGVRLAVQAAVAIKIPALRLAAELAASLNAGPAFAFSYTGQLGTVGSEISALYGVGLVDGANSITPTENVYGVTILSSVPSVQAALQAIIQV